MIVMSGEEEDLQHASTLIPAALATAQQVPLPISRHTPLPCNLSFESLSFRLQLTLAGDEDACSIALDIVYDFSSFLQRSDAHSHSPQILAAHIKVCRRMCVITGFVFCLRSAQGCRLFLCFSRVQH